MTTVVLHPLRRRRIELGMKQTELAARAHARTVNISQWEHGLRVPDHRIAHLAKALKWSVEECCAALGYTIVK